MSEARKAERDGTRKPLTAAEQGWVDRVLKALIERMAAHAADPDAELPQITLADLPPP
jgi:hypothetical protein